MYVGVQGAKLRGGGGAGYVVLPAKNDAHARACATRALASDGNCDGVPTRVGSPIRGAPSGRSLQEKHINVNRFILQG